MDVNSSFRPGVTMTCGQLSARFIDNSPRLIHISDNVLPGYNGVAVLMDRRQNKNIFTSTGLNYEICNCVPPSGVEHDKWNAPRVAPMTIEATGPLSVRLAQKGADASGLNVLIDFTLGESFVDQTLTAWPDSDIRSSDLLFASYMNQVQNTSLVLRGAVEGESSPRWLEVSKVAHRSKTLIWRPFDPAGKRWDQHRSDDPALRQAIEFETPAVVAAAEAAGFRPTPFRWVDRFYYGLVDDFVFLMIFREEEFGLAYSPTGCNAVRGPAWDYTIHAGAQRRDERRVYHARLVYQPFTTLEDILAEVRRFQEPAAGAASGPKRKPEKRK